MSQIEVFELGSQILRLRVLKEERELAVLRVNGSMDQIWAAESSSLSRISWLDLYQSLDDLGLSNVPFRADIATLGILASVRDDQSMFYYPEKLALQRDANGEPFPDGEKYAYNESFHITTRNLIEKMLNSAKIEMK